MLLFLCGVYDFTWGRAWEAAESEPCHRISEVCQEQSDADRDAHSRKHVAEPSCLCTLWQVWPGVDTSFVSRQPDVQTVSREHCDMCC